MLPESSSAAFAVVHDEATGRRWRYRLPLTRVLLSGGLLALGVVLLPLGLALPSLATAIAGGVALAPGAYASYCYYAIYRGTFTGQFSTFLDAEDVPEGQG
jgi:hypothetical protein